MTEFISSQMKAFHIPGAAVGIIHRDSIIYLRGFGAADDAGRPVTPQTPFLIGSNSKSFTALAVMQLVEAGKVNLDAPVRQYLHWFQLQDAKASEAITVRHLLNQTGGLPTAAGFSPPASPDPRVAAEHYAAELRGLRPAHPPGQHFEYCNLNFEILGMLVEAVAQQPYAAYVQEHVLGPLGMRSTYLTYEDATTHGLAGGHQYIFGFPVRTSPRRYGPHAVAAGGIASTAEDMCRYLIAQLDGGAYEGRQVIAPTGLALMHEPRSEIGSAYGMGWFIRPWNGLKSINHTGLNQNFSSMMNILPEKGYGVIILTNVNSFSVLGKNNLMDGVIRRLHGQERRSYWPQELLIRLLLLAALLCVFVRLALQAWKWRRLRYAVAIRLTTRVLFTLAAGLMMQTVWLVLIPAYADAPVRALFDFQPDIGYGLAFGAVGTFLNTLLGAFIKSCAPGRRPSTVG
ncbi:MAG TPA: serine hydrolase domain-containing protein [Pyrinomonadaceae bacterium]|nr:serine hydrolase domain-containing protein [Pyrinomonadaceae bacterium]